MSSEENYQHYEKRLQNVLSHIYENLDAELDLDALADVANMSRYQWHCIFRAMTGETLADSVRRLRLHKAANALVLENDPISKIAKRVGYPNAASFSRAFTKSFGVSPTDFRDQSKKATYQLQSMNMTKKMYLVTIKKMPPQKAAGVLHTGSYAQIGMVFQRLGGILAARPLFSQVAGLFVIYHDAPGSKPTSQLRSHVAVEINDGFPDELEELEYFDVEGGKYAVMEHCGPYPTLKSAYDWFYGKWLPESGEEPRDAPPIEYYVNDPKTTAPKQLRTDIRLPLV